MTIEQLLDCSAEQLEKMSDAQLLEHFQKYLNVTRPEKAAAIREQRRPTNNTPKSVTPVYLSPQKKLALAAMQEAGIDMEFTKKFGRKK